MVVGNIYSTTTSSTSIIQSTADGQFVATQSLPGYSNGLRGLEFGPDGSLYVLAVTPTGYDVLRIGGSGQTRGRYVGEGEVASFLPLGKIVTTSGRKFYVTEGRGLVAYDGTSSEGRIIYTPNGALDAKVKPSGDLFVLSDYAIHEITPHGHVKREVPTSIPLGDARGIEYDPATGKLFVTMLGYTGYNFQFMRFDSLTGALERNQFFSYGIDIAFLQNGRLLVGSHSQAPGIFTQEIGFIGPLNSVQQTFVAVMKEPTVLFEDGLEGY